MDIQTRCRGFLEYFETIAEAHDAWVLNNYIEKISWTEDESRQIWRHFKKGTMGTATEDHLCAVSEKYRDSEEGSDWWYKDSNSDVIKEFATDAEFVARFC